MPTSYPADLDVGGNLNQWVKAYLGPTVGWIMLPVMPETFVTAGPTYTVQRGDSRVMLNATAVPVTSVLLPDIVTWVRTQVTLVRSAFDGSLWIKDLAYTATASPITITPSGAQTIDKLASFQVINNGQLIRLYPLSDLSGWYVA